MAYLDLLALVSHLMLFEHGNERRNSTLRFSNTLRMALGRANVPLTAFQAIEPRTRHLL